MRVLLVVHGYPPDPGGGTEIYTRDLAVALAESGVEVFVLTREADPTRPDGAVRHEQQGAVRVARINNTFASCRSFEDTYRHPAVLAAAEAVVAEVRPDVAHVHHLTCLSTDLVASLARRNVAVVLTLHDYWLLCHRGQLVDLDDARCAGPGTGACERCVPSQVTLGGAAYRGAAIARRVPGAAPVVAAAANLLRRVTGGGAEASAVRLRHMREVVGLCDRVLAPSATVGERFAASGMPTARTIPWTLGIGFRPAIRVPRRAGEALRLGFAGAFLPTKAPHLLIEAAARLPAGTVSVDLAGAAAGYHGDLSYRDRLQPWLAHPVVRRHGPVPHREMPAYLARLDVLVLPSVWLENSPLVIKEAFAAGLPVVVSDLGGMAELVRHEVDGLRFPAGDADALATCLRRLVDEAGLLNRLAAGVGSHAAIAGDAARTLGVYSELLAARRSAVPSVSRPHVAAVVLNYRAAEETALAVLSLQRSFAPPASIVVVDNTAAGSADPVHVPLDRDGRGSVTVIGTPRNLGFAAGCNVGIDAALAGGAQYVLLMNSDAVLAPDALSLLLAAAAAHPTAGILGPLVVCRAEPGTIESAGLAFDVASGRMRLLLAGRPVAEARAEPADVIAVTGCVMLIQRAVFDRIGRLDAAYFYSFEDLDFCLRAGAAGFTVLCVPQARAHHQGGQAIGRRSPRRVYFATRNHLRLASRLEARTARRALTAAAIVAWNTAYVLTSADAPLWSGLAAVLRGSWHHLIGRYGPDSAA